MGRPRKEDTVTDDIDMSQPVDMSDRPPTDINQLRAEVESMREKTDLLKQWKELKIRERNLKVVTGEKTWLKLVAPLPNGGTVYDRICNRFDPDTGESLTMQEHITLPMNKAVPVRADIAELILYEVENDRKEDKENGKEEQSPWIIKVDPPK